MGHIYENSAHSIAHALHTFYGKIFLVSELGAIIFFSGIVFPLKSLRRIHGSKQVLIHGAVDSVQAMHLQHTDDIATGKRHKTKLEQQNACHTQQQRFSDDGGYISSIDSE